MLDLSNVPVIDNHVHPWRPASANVGAEQLAAEMVFSEAVVSSVRTEFLPRAELEAPLRLYRHTTISSKILLHDLARFLGVADTWEAVVEARNREAGKDYRAWTERLFKDAGLVGLMMDEGGSKPRVTPDELSKIAPVTIRRVARTDNFIRDLLPAHDTWGAFLKAYDAELNAAVDEGKTIAFKSVIAYRTGLNVQPVSEAEARAGFERTRTAPESEQKTWRDFLFCRAMDVARERNIWFHIHAAVGDPDIQFQRANPGQLWPLLHSEPYRRNRVVLVHGGWPWVGEASVMVSLLPNLYLDVSEGAIFGLANLKHRIHEVLEAAPYSKVLYAADSSIPEGLWVVAKRYKRALGQVLGELAGEGMLTLDEAHAAGRMILHDNAARMYGL